ncbi:MAG: choice-of-anchor R domain-containing protein [Candidatus Giovannonibacteria bacterium]|nr:choice-of-anchor R domain-containing protein [Candidatus Giovannonibacteria bacterium]
MKIQKQEQAPRMAGQAAMTAVILMLFIMLSAIFGASSVALKEAKVAEENKKSKLSFFAAESGLEDAVYRLKRGKNLTSSFSLTLNGATSNTTVTSSGGRKDIYSEGSNSGDIRALSSVLLNSTGISFYYGAQVGEGGMIMDQQSQIKGSGGAAGNIYSNGSVSGESGATVTGDLIVATGVTEDTNARSTTCGEDQIVGQANPQIDFAQSFKPSDSKPLAKISLYLKKVGSPGDATIRITSDIGGVPAKSSLASATLSSGSVGTSYGWVDVAFSSPPNLTSGTTYWFILDASKDANKYYIWCKDSGAGYANGSPKYSQDWNDDPWAGVSGDLDFKTYLGTGVSSIDGVVVYGNAKANTITNSKICGNAYYQSIDAGSLSFLNNPSNPTCPDPLTSGTAFPGSSDPPPQNMPISDSNIQSWKNDAVAGGTITGNCGDNGVSGCNIGDNGTLSLGPKKIVGNLVLTKKQTLVVTGTLYFTGHLDMDSSSGATVKCDPSFGANSCVVIFDSWIHLKNNSLFQGSGTAGSYILILTTLTGCNGGEETSPCTHHNGAIDLHNNATGAIFYAGDSMINLHNGVGVTELTAYKLRLDNGAIVTYEQGLTNANFSSGPSGGWNIKSWGEIVP